MRTGSIENLDIAPQATKDYAVNYGEITPGAEWLLNVEYALKEAENILPAGQVIAREQIALTEPVKPGCKMCVAGDAPTVNDADNITVSGTDFTVVIDKATGLISRYDVNGTEMLKNGESIRPNFWRAPTDNDYGAGLQKKYRTWLNPEMKLKSLTHEAAGNKIKVNATYEMPSVKATLDLTYIINAIGNINITQKFTPADEKAEISDMFRFGMIIPMPKAFDEVEYYGRGPGENYIDRQHAMQIGIYRQSVASQLVNTAKEPFSASALNYTVGSLDGGEEKTNTHFPEVRQADMTEVCVDLRQMGLGCVNSWGALPLPEYRLPYGTYTFNYTIIPVTNALAQ